MTKLTDKQLDDLASITRLYDRDPTIAEVARILKRNWVTVQHWLRESGIGTYQVGKNIFVPLPALLDWTLPTFVFGRKLRDEDVLLIRARKMAGQSRESVMVDYPISKRAFDRVWDGESYRRLI